MPIRVKCEKCKKTLSVKDHLAGKKIKCPVCQNIVLVSAGAAPPKEEPPAKPTSAGDAPAGKQPAVATKPAKTAKPPADKTQTNGTPSPEKAKSNGAPAAKKPTSNGAPVADKAKPNGPPPKPPEPPTVERPPEHAEAEALEAFAEELKPVEDETPKTIDFSCPWCEMELHLPLEDGGKQQQCPNPECKRIIKVPLPKIPEKGDWRKMERRGPSAAILNQPEQLDDAWGTEEAVNARQSSLAEAGALAEPVKPPLGVLGWLRRGFYGLCLFVLLIVAGVGLSRLLGAKQQTDFKKDAIELVEPVPTKDNPNPEPKIKKQLLQAEARRAIALLWLRSTERKAATQAQNFFLGAQALAQVKITKEEHGVNEQMFLADLALSRIEFASTIDEFNADKVWEKINEDLKSTLQAIPAPEIQAIAMREVANRLIEKGRLELAIGLAGSLSADPSGKPRPVAAQHIALLCKKGDETTLKNAPDLAKINELKDAIKRAGFAEGYARKEQYEDALKLAIFAGPAKDRLEACLGVAAVALQDRKNKAEATRFLEKAREIIKENNAAAMPPWHILQLLRLGLRTDDAESYKPLLDSLSDPQFKLRARVEMLQAKCDKATSRLAPEVLADIESEDKEGTTLALAWMILARHNARLGDSRAQNRAMFEQHMRTSNPNVGQDLLRPMVDVGTYLGAPK